MRDSLRVGVGEPDPHAGRERVAAPRARYYGSTGGSVERLVRAHPRARTLCRAHRRGRHHRVRHPGLSLGGRDLGAVRPDGVRDDRRVPRRSGQGLGLLCATARPAGAGGAERRPPRPRRARAARLRRRGDHAEHRLSPRARRLTVARRGARLDPHVQDCLDCGEVVPLRGGAEVASQRAGARMPDLRADLKPDVVMFGELLPAAAIARATQLAAGARLLLVVGSSLEVYPVAGLPLETLAAGGSLAIVNRGVTQFDRCASVTIDAGAGETLRAVAAGLPGRREGTSRRSPRGTARSAVTRRARTPARRGRPRTTPEVVADHASALCAWQPGRRERLRVQTALRRPRCAAVRRRDEADAERARPCAARAGVVRRVDERKMTRLQRIRGEAGDEHVDRRGGGGDRHTQGPGPCLAAVDRRGDDEVVLRARAPETAVAPHGVDLPRGVDVDRRQRDRAHRLVVARVQDRDDGARERCAAVGRAKRDDVPGESRRAVVVAGDDDKRPVGLHDRLRPDERRRRADGWGPR